MSVSKRRLALKVDVDTLQGTRDGVPRLARLFDALGVTATFLFSVGPDHTGRALRRIFKPGFLAKVSRTSVVSHYGLKTLLYGTLLPGPHIGRSCVSEMRAVRDAGFETGLHVYDHVKWQDFVIARDRVWTQQEMQRGIEAYDAVFDARPSVHGAAGWQMNDAAFELEQRSGFEYASDTRGTHAFVPALADAIVGCPQLPTTLPTLDELLGVDGMRAEDATSRLLDLTRESTTAHVYTLHAELEGMRLTDVLRKLIEGWRQQGYELGSLRQLYDSLDISRLPRHRVVMAPVAGRAGNVAMQGVAIDADRAQREAVDRLAAANGE